MTATVKNKPSVWLRLGFLISAEDSTVAGDRLPEWATPCYCRCKALFWIVAGITAAILVGQL